MGRPVLTLGLGLRDAPTRLDWNAFNRGGEGLGRSGRRLATGWDKVDLALAGRDGLSPDHLCVPREDGAGPGRIGGHVGVAKGLPWGAVHEWFGSAGPDVVTGPAGAHAVRSGWPPVAVLLHVARLALESRGSAPDPHARSRERPRSSLAVVVGRSVWPSALALRRVPSLRDRLVLVDAPSVDERVWAIDLALRSAGVRVVIGDGGGLTMAHSRRLQLAAGAGGTLGLLARPASELRALSAACTRWLIEPAPSPDTAPRWSVHLLRCKGVQPISEDARRWVVRLNHAAGTVDLVSHVRDRRDEAASTGEAGRLGA